MIIEYIKNQNMTKDQAFEYGSKKLGYLPDKLRETYQ